MKIIPQMCFNEITVQFDVIERLPKSKWGCERVSMWPAMTNFAQL